MRLDPRTMTSLLDAESGDVMLLHQPVVVVDQTGDGSARQQHRRDRGFRTLVKQVCRIDCHADTDHCGERDADDQELSNEGRHQNWK